MKTRCSIMGCRHETSRPIEGAEWICARHWSALPKRQKRAFTRLVRRWRRMTASVAAFDPVEYDRLIVRLDRLWEWLKRRAFEIDAGL